MRRSGQQKPWRAQRRPSMGGRLYSEPQPRMAVVSPTPPPVRADARGAGASLSALSARRSGARAPIPPGCARRGASRSRAHAPQSNCGRPLPNGRWQSAVRSRSPGSRARQLPLRVIDEGHAAGHAGREVIADRAENDGRAAGHVFAAIRAAALDHRLGARNCAPRSVRPLGRPRTVCPPSRRREPCCR